MSGLIRQKLGPAKARLGKYLSEAVSLRDASASKVELLDLCKRITVTTRLINECLQEWTVVLQGLTSEADTTKSAAEERLFHDAATMPDGVSIFDWLLDAGAAVCRLEALLEIAPSPSVSVVAQASSSAQGQSSSPPVSLPKITLPTFNGDVSDYPSFWEMFSTCVDQQPLAPAAKFSYLLGCLRGPAKEALTGVAVTSGNYQTALDILEEKFGRKDVIIDTLLTRLHLMPAADGTSLELSKTVDAVESVLRQLETLGESLENRLLVKELLGKFPLDMLEKLEEQRGTSSWTVRSLREAVKSYVRRKEDAARLYGQARDGQVNMRTSSTSNAFTVTKATRAHSSKKMSPCAFCSGNHLHKLCTVYSDVSSRKSRLQDLGSCFVCLSTGHRASRCPLRSKRSCVRCNQSGHHPLICTEQQPQGVASQRQPPPTVSQDLTSRQATMEPSKTDYSTSPVSSVSTVSTSNRPRQVMLQTASVVVQPPHGSSRIRARALLDSGSQRTFVTKRLAEALKLPLDSQEQLSVATFGATKPTVTSTYLVECALVLKDGSSFSILGSVLDHLTRPIQRGSVPAKDMDFIKSMSPSCFADSIPTEPDCVDIDILIGADFVWNLLCSNDRLVLPSGLFLLNSRLGYILTGSCFPDQDKGQYSVLAESAMTVGSFLCGNVFSRLDDFWRLDTLGVLDPSQAMSDDDIATAHLANTLHYDEVEHRYSVSFPWKDNIADLPDNFSIAFNRMKSLSRRLSQDLQLFHQYDEVIEQQVKKGIIEKVPPGALDGTPLHYLPHRPVLTPTKTTTKLRVVYDASSKRRKTDLSLNECLHRGPVLLPDLCGVLLRYRTFPIAILSDIEKAFLQIEIQPDDRDVTRFLWYKDKSTPSVVDGNLDTYRFCRVPFGIISSPFLLQGTIKHHLQRKEHPVAAQIEENIYVDNVSLGATTPAAGVGLYSAAKQIFSEAGMNLREWTSNCQELLRQLPMQDVFPGTIVKVLGLMWSTSADTLQLSSPDMQELQSVSTKRQALHCICAVYDPLGLFNPVVFHGKLFIQALWMSKVTWDEPFTPALQHQWNDLVHHLASVSTVAIPRLVTSSSTPAVYHLITFCDASARMYAAATYLRTASHGGTTAKLVFSKIRLAPTAKRSRKDSALTIPRLELLSVFIGVRTHNFYSRENACISPDSNLRHQIA